MSIRMRDFRQRSSLANPRCTVYKRNGQSVARVKAAAIARPAQARPIQEGTASIVFSTPQLPQITQPFGAGAVA